VPAGFLQREDRVAADVAGAAGDEDWDLAHAAALAKRGGEFQPEQLMSVFDPFLPLAASVTLA
jgi:hypothetical protein